jgi:hypothetical protein
MIRYPTRDRLLPRNRRAVDVATRTLESLAQPAKQQYTNAIAVNGVPSLLYIRLTAGQACSCRALNTVSYLDESGNLSQDVMTSLLTGNDVVIRERNEKNPTERRDGHERYSLDDLEVFHRETDEPEDLTISDQRDDPPELDVWSNLGLDNAGRVHCNVCFGTGIVGGFNLYGGYRLVLTPMFTRIDFVDSYVDTQAAPNQFVAHLPHSNRVTFTTILPRGLYISTVQVWDNNSRISSHQYTVMCDSTPLLPGMEARALNSLIQGREVRLSVSGKSEDFRFTHLEIQGSFLRPEDTLRVEFPKLDRNPRLAILDGITGSQIILPPMIPQVRHLSVITDSLYRQTWVITSATEFCDHNRNIHGWETTARLAQAFESYTNLPGLTQAAIRAQTAHSRTHTGTRDTGIRL